MKRERITLPIYNLGCGGGSALMIERALTQAPGVMQAHVNPLTEMAYIVYDPGTATAEQLANVIDRTGYGPSESPVSDTQVAVLTETLAKPCRSSSSPSISLGERNRMMVTQSERRAWPWYLWLAGFVVLAVLISAGFGIWRVFTPTPSVSPAAPVVSNGSTQSNEGGPVTVKASWDGTSSGPVFKVVLDTHSVDLDSIDLTRLTVLRVDGGSEVRPTSWDAPKGGHHRSGTLTFPTTTADGKPLISAETHTVELFIRDVAGVPERAFVWKP